MPFGSVYVVLARAAPGAAGHLMRARAAAATAVLLHPFCCLTLHCSCSRRERAWERLLLKAPALCTAQRGRATCKRFRCFNCAACAYV